MTRPYGIDTSILVRLATGKPEPDFRHCVEELRALIEEGCCEIFASNQVIGEAYIVLQHHYNVSDTDARVALIDVLTSGLVAPLNGQSVIMALRSQDEPGLVRQADRRRLRKGRNGYADSGPQDGVSGDG